MVEIFLTYPTPEGSREILFDGESLSFGRGSDADFRFDDDGLSRLHATVFREGEKVWVIDENSTNGSFVNGEKVPPQGTPLKSGDRIKIGHYTELRVRFAEKKSAPAPVPNAAKPKISAAGEPSSLSSLQGFLPIVLIALAVGVIAVSATVIGIKVIGGNTPPVAQKTPDYSSSPDFEDEEPTETPKEKKSPTPAPTEKTSNGNVESVNTTPETPDKTPPVNTVPRKKFAEMSEAERDEYVKVKAEKIARIIGNQTSEPIPPEAVRSIRGHLKGYVDRVRASRVDNCSQGVFMRSDMTTVLERASKNAPFIIRSFYGENMDPQIGLYVAMIESEHCPCLQSPTKALGMFQFVRGTGREYDLEIKNDASPTNPDQRCQPEPAARAAARYLKYLTGRFGTGPMSFPLAIAAYNSGQGGLSQNLDKALKSAAGEDRSFWTLVANQVAFEGKIGEQFRKENVKYVPKFFAAAIIGENPQDFGVNIQPLSTYTK